MPPSSPSMEAFDLDIQKEITLSKTKNYLSKNSKKHTKIMQVSKATSSIRLFALLDIHYNNILITETQKQNGT